MVILQPMKKVIGHQKVANIIAGGFAGLLREDGSIEAEIQVITGATSEFVYNTLTAKAF